MGGVVESGTSVWGVLGVKASLRVVRGYNGVHGVCLYEGSKGMYFTDFFSLLMMMTFFLLEWDGDGMEMG